MQVKDIQYIARDYSQIHPKHYVGLYVKSLEHKFPEANYQYILNKRPITYETTSAEIVDMFKKSLYSDSSVSKMAEKLVFVKEFQNEYNGVIDDIETYPQYKYDIFNISNTNDLMPNPTIVWEINKICPTICGIIFENIIADILGIELNVSNLDDKLIDPNSNFESKNIIGILNRNFIKLNIKYCSIIDSEIHIIDYSGRSSKLTESDFITKWHYIVFSSMLHFIKYDFPGHILEDTLNILDYIMKNYRDMEIYYHAISKSSFIKKMKKDSEIKHSLYNKTEQLRGEVDFISSSAIYDVKSYKSESLDIWFTQLYLYTKLFGEREQLYIINVYNNKIYRFTIP